MDEQRAQARQQFLQQQGWGAAKVQALAADASFRRYFRLRQDGQAKMLMDAPPPREDVRPFILIAEHLEGVGVRPPRLGGRDLEQGFVLLEDFGEQTFTRLLDSGLAEAELYPAALESLLKLHAHPANAAVTVPTYDAEVAANEAALLVDWYLPALTGRMPGVSARSAWLEAWRTVVAALPALQPVLVLRDFHVDNLMLLADGDCGLLDFQDALIGSPAYDLASLLEDARRDLPESLRERLKAQYLGERAEINAQAFDAHYRIWSAQRHAKVLGIFLRLWLRDGKSVYLQHIPRVLALFQRRLGDVELAPVAAWIEQHLPELGQALLDATAVKRRFVAAGGRSAAR